jgi:hypothetical protein
MIYSIHDSSYCFDIKFVNICPLFIFWGCKHGLVINQCIVFVLYYVNYSISSYEFERYHSRLC